MARVIHIDSRLRKSGRAEDMVYELNEPIHLPRGAVCWCTAITLPFSLTNVSTLNNTLHVTERTLRQSQTAQVVIDADEYGRTGLGQALVDALNSHVSRGASILPKAVTYSVDNSQAHELSFGLLWNDDADRYDYTGSYQVDSTTTISNVYRDWRSLTVRDEPSLPMGWSQLQHKAYSVGRKQCLLHWHCGRHFRHKRLRLAIRVCPHARSRSRRRRYRSSGRLDSFRHRRLRGMD